MVWKRFGLAAKSQQMAQNRIEGFGSWQVCFSRTLIRMKISETN